MQKDSKLACINMLQGRRNTLHCFHMWHTPRNPPKHTHMAKKTKAQQIDATLAKKAGKPETPLTKALKVAKANLEATPSPAEAAPEVVTPPTDPTPPPTPAESPTPANTPPPAIELVRDGESGKRYVAKTAPDSKYHLRDRSDVAKPVAVVWGMCAAHPDLTRKEVIALCVAAGVNKNTAMTQYSMWKRKQNNAPANAIPGMVALDADGNEVDPNEHHEVDAPLGEE